MTSPDGDLEETRPSIDSPFPPDCAAKYRVLKPIGRGGFGDVYLAEQIALRRRVAIKLLNPASLAAPGHQERFLEEARITGALRDPHIVRLLDQGTGQGRPWIVFEYLEGRPLGKDTPVRRTWQQILDIGVQIASALAEAHHHGIVHRDLKPENVLQMEDDQVKVLDFGIAKWTGDSRVQTEKGTVMGTPRYMPPEAFAGPGSSPRWDVYSLGVMLVELAMGSLPFPQDLAGMLRAKLADKVMEQALATSPLPASFRRVLLRATASDPAERLADGAELLEALRAVEQTSEQRAAMKATELAPAPSRLDLAPVPSRRDAVLARGESAPGSDESAPAQGGLAAARPPAPLVVALTASGMLVAALFVFVPIRSPAPPSAASPAASVAASDFVPLATVDRRAECRALTQRATEVTPHAWQTGFLDFYVDPRHGHPAALPGEAFVELETSGELPAPPPTLWLNGEEAAPLGRAGPDGSFRIPLPSARLLPGLNRVSLRQDPPDPALNRRVTRLTLHGRGARPAGDLRHFFDPPAVAGARPPYPATWERLMVAKSGDGLDLLVGGATQALAGDPANPWTRWALAHGLDKMGQPADALPSYGSATVLIPHETWILSDLGRCLSKLERLDEANRFLEIALQRAQQSGNLSCVYWTSLNLAGNAAKQEDPVRQSHYSRIAQEALAKDDSIHPGVKDKADFRNVADFLTR